MSDARLHAINASPIVVMNHFGLNVNSEHIPAMAVKAKDGTPAAPTPQKEPPSTSRVSGGLKASSVHTVLPLPP